MSEPTTAPHGEQPQRHLEIRCTLFGSTLAEVAGALDGMPLGGLIAVRTNDP